MKQETPTNNLPKSPSKMKLFLSDPDGVTDSIRDTVTASMPPGLSDDEQGAWLTFSISEVKKSLEKWVFAGQYVAIKLDFEAGTAHVVTEEEA